MQSKFLASHRHFSPPVLINLCLNLYGHVRCFPVYLGGSADEIGVSHGGKKRSCSNVRCTACDFAIVNFVDSSWSSSVDYLFFRNNMPEKDKLRARLKSSPGTIAYACQCKWRSFSSLVNISEDTELKWVCGRHVV